jgi:hypothetical protein
VIKRVDRSLALLLFMTGACKSEPPGIVGKWKSQDTRIEIRQGAGGYQLISNNGPMFLLNGTFNGTLQDTVLGLDTPVCGIVTYSPQSGTLKWCDDTFTRQPP